MQLFKNRTLALATTGLMLGTLAGGLQACDGENGPLGDLAEQCGLTCSAKGIVQGNASISGIASIDAFFGAIVDLNSAAASIDASIRAELDKMALSVGLERGAAAVDIRAAIEAKLTAAIDGGISIKYKPAECKASVEVSVNAAAECDAEVTPGMVDVKCEGSCQVEAGAMVDCGANAELKCTGTAPNLMCEGSCTGSCNLEVAAACEGSCKGECDGTCSVCTGGQCNMGAGGTTTNCEGQCMGMCTGSCELSAGGSCSGKCEGSCEWTPPEAMCEANVEAKCEAMASASVDCKGECTGKAEPPMVKAECEASVEAKANASVQCTPPELDIQFQWSAEFAADVNAQAEFKAWLQGFRVQFSAMIAASAKAEILIDALANLSAAANGAVDGAINAALDGDLKAKIGAGCAATELEAAVMVIGQATTKVQGSASAFAEISGAVGGG